MTAKVKAEVVPLNNIYLNDLRKQRTHRKFLQTEGEYEDWCILFSRKKETPPQTHRRSGFTWFTSYMIIPHSLPSFPHFLIKVSFMILIGLLLGIPGIMTRSSNYWSYQQRWQIWCVVTYATAIMLASS